MCPISGGNWNNSSGAGVWTLNLNNVRTNSNNNVGFRADSVPRRSQFDQGGIKGDAFRRVRQRAAKSAGWRDSGRPPAGFEGFAP